MKRGNGKVKIFEELMDEQFLNLMKIIKPPNPRSSMNFKQKKENYAEIRSNCLKSVT